VEHQQLRKKVALVMALLGYLLPKLRAGTVLLIQAVALVVVLTTVQPQLHKLQVVLA
jgi:hypothetical protein